MVNYQCYRCGYTIQINQNNKSFERKYMYNTFK